MTTAQIPDDFRTIFQIPRDPTGGATAFATTDTGELLGPDEPAFRKWYAGWSQITGQNPDPDHPKNFYDYRAAFKAGVKPDEAGNWPNDFHTAGHPSRFVDGVDTINVGKTDIRFAADLPEAATIPMISAGPEPAPGFFESVKREFIVAQMGSTSQALGERLRVLKPAQFNQYRDYARTVNRDIMDVAFDELESFVEGVAPPGLERGDGVGGYIGSAAGTILFDFSSPLLLAGTLFRIGGQRARAVLEETDDMGAAVTAGTIDAFGTLLFFRLLGKRGEKAGLKYNDAYRSAAKRGEPLLRRALLAGDRAAANKVVRGIAKDAAIGLGGGVLISEATLVTDEFTQAIWGNQSFAEASKRVQLAAPEVAIDAIFEGLFIFGFGAVSSSLRAKKDGFIVLARNARTDVEILEVIRQAKVFADRHGDAQQFVANLTLDQLQMHRTRHAGRSDAHHMGMTMLIDARLAQMVGGRAGPMTGAESEAFDSIRSRTRDPSPAGRSGLLLPGPRWPLSPPEVTKLRSLGWTEAELEARPEAVFWRGVLNRDIRNPDTPLQHLMERRPELAPKPARIGPERDMEIRENYYEGAPVEPLLGPVDLRAVVTAVEKGQAQKAEKALTKAKEDPLFEAEPSELVRIAEDSGIDIDALEIERPRAGGTMEEADRAKLVRAIQVGPRPGSEAAKRAEAEGEAAPAPLQRVEEEPARAEIEPEVEDRLPHEMALDEYEAFLLEHYPDGILPDGRPITPETAQSLQEVARAAANGEVVFRAPAPPAAPPAAPAVTPADLRKMSVQQLKGEATRLRIPFQGTKARMMERIIAAEAQARAAAPQRSGQELVQEVLRGEPELAPRLAVVREAPVEPAAAPTLAAVRGSPEPSTEAKIGDAISVMGVESILADVKETGGVRYELYNDARGRDTGGAIRVVDVDSGGVVTIRRFPLFEDAEEAHETAFAKAGPAEATLPFDEPPGPQRGTPPPPGARRGMVDPRIIDIPARAAGRAIVRGARGAGRGVQGVAELWHGGRHFFVMDMIDDVRRQGGPVGRELADMAERTVNKTKEIWGELRDAEREALKIRLHPAASFRLQEVDWSPDSPAGFARIQAGMEGVENVIATLTPRELEFILSGRHFATATGEILVREGFRQRNRVSGELEPFVPTPGGFVFLRAPTVDMFNLFANPSGKVWDAYVEAIAFENGWSIAQAREVTGQLTRANFHRIGPEISRLIPNHPTHLKLPNGQAYTLLHTHPTSYIHNAIRSVAMRVGFKQEFGQGFEGDVTTFRPPAQAGLIGPLPGTTLSQLRNLYIEARGTPESFDRTMRVLSGLDTVPSPMPPGTPGYEIVRGIGTIGLGVRSTMLTRASVPNTVEPAGNIRAWAGTRRFLLAMGDIIRLSDDYAARLRTSGLVPESIPIRSGLGEVSRLLQRLGIVGQDLLDITVDRDRWISGAVRRYGDAVLRIFPTRPVWTWQENLGAAVGLRVALEITEGRGSTLDYLTARALDFDKATAEKIASGTASNDIALDYARRYAAQTNTTRMTLPAEESRAVNNRWWKAMMWFTRYPFMKGRTFSKDVWITGETLKDFARSPTRENGKRATLAGVRFFSGIVGTAAAGEAYQLFLAWLMGGQMGVMAKLNEQREDIDGAVLEAWITGMAGPIITSVINIGRTRDINSWWRISPAASFTVDMISASFSSAGFGLGDYSDMVGDPGLIWSRLARRYAPGPRALQSLLGLRGIGRKNPQMETAISAFYRFKRDQPDIQQAKTQITKDEENSRAFRNKIRRVYDLLKSNDMLDPDVIDDVNRLLIDALEIELTKAEAEGLLTEAAAGKAAKSKIARALRSRKLLPDLNDGIPLSKGLGPKLSEFLRIHGERLFLELIEHDERLEQWAKAVSPPRRR